MKVIFYLLAETLNKSVVKVNRKPLHLVTGLHMLIARAFTFQRSQTKGLQRVFQLIIIKKVTLIFEMLQ